MCFGPTSEFDLGYTPMRSFPKLDTPAIRSWWKRIPRHLAIGTGDPITRRSLATTNRFTKPMHYGMSKIFATCIKTRRFLCKNKYPRSCLSLRLTLTEVAVITHPWEPSAKQPKLLFWRLLISCVGHQPKPVSSAHEKRACATRKSQ